MGEFNLENEMLAMIEKNLPAATAKSLGDYLTSAAADKEALRIQVDALNKANDLIDRLRKENSEIINENTQLKLEIQDARLTKINADKNLQDLAITVANERTASMTRERDTILRLVDKVFGHPNVTVTTNSNRNDLGRTTEITNSNETTSIIKS